MDFAGNISIDRYNKSPDPRIRLLTVGLQLALYDLYCYIIIIRLLQTMVGNEISS